MFNTNFLFASLIWGSVGAGYCIYGKRQSAIVPFLGGLMMIGASYFVGSWFWMSVICIALGVGVYLLAKWGY
jgi:hypothetical protein